MTNTAHEIAEVLQYLAEEDDAAFESIEAEVDHAASYADAGVLTQNAGFVLRLVDGSEFQITIVRSR